MTFVKAPLSKDVYEYLAEFRYQIRKFLHFSEAAARSHGLTPKQHQLLLAVKGFPGRDYVTPRELAERLQITHHACVGLIDRCEQLGLVKRRPNPEDGRSVLIEVTDQGLEILQTLSGIHLEEIKRTRFFKE
ncbi:MarR family winged helix-turn-helix transcriptional regulator [Bacillus capparidis]|uniref:MarR family transcriptional regulator n=1 Tax=Bacillus gobiensis TaxID=1441095 RepID=A0A0M4FTP3_9BACI|nr:MULTISPECIES: helix-turn-helix domain-containing protein [Bacillus]ALC83435.1 MarR family transcriptional regulator [Bacillus gobiensis]MED1097365.1 helix-turn-helix domain-containing protein [Bacillus capparidis]